MTSGNLFEPRAGACPGAGRSVILVFHECYQTAIMRRDQDNALEALMEQLIESGTEEMASVFASLFNLAMRIERERFLCAREGSLGFALRSRDDEHEERRSCTYCAREPG